MGTTLIGLLVLALILWVIYYVVGLFIQGTPHQIVGIILGLIFLIRALAAFGLANL
jgi:predicted membrane chloride channel (bestrophin family)